VAPMGLTMIVIGAPTMTVQPATGAAIASATIGVLVQRWLFFAKAKAYRYTRHNGLGLLEARDF
jgi:hypothetical protein